MKKLFVISLIALMTMAFGGMALAATELKASGENVMGGFYIDNMGAGDYAPVAFMSYEINKIDLKFLVAKGLTFNIRLVANLKAWGRNQTTPNNPNISSAEASTVEMLAANVELYNKIGWFRFGRYQVPFKGGVAVAGKYGACDSMVGANRYWARKDAVVDRILYIQKWGMYKLTLLYEKIYEQDNVTTTADQDYDLYYSDHKFSWKNGGVDLVVCYSRNYSVIGIEYNQNVWAFAFDLAHKFGPVNVAMEAQYTMGTTKAPALNMEKDNAGLDFYIEVEFQSKRILSGVAYGYTNGQDSSNKMTAGRGVGNGFQPLYAAFGAYDGLMYNRANNLSVILAWFEMAVTSNIWIHVGAGYINTPQMDAGRTSKDMGSEIDLGVKFIATKALDFQVHFGYFMPGAYYPSGENVLHADWLMTLNY